MKVVVSFSLVLFINFVGLFSFPAVSSIYLSRETYKAGVVKSKAVELQALLRILQTYDEHLPLLTDPAKETAGNEEFSQKIDEKAKEFKEKTLVEASGLFDKVLLVSKEFTSELVKEESDTSVAGFFGYNKENEEAKKQLLDRYNKAIKDFDEKYLEGKKMYNELFKLCYEKLGPNNETIKGFIRSLHLAKFQALMIRALVVISYVRRDEVGDANTEGYKWFVAPFANIEEADNAFRNVNSRFQKCVLGFLRNAKEGYDGVIEKVVILETKAKDGINQSKEKLEDAKKALDEVKKLGQEIEDEAKKVKEAFKKYYADFDVNYKERNAKIDFSVEKKELDVVVKRIEDEVPKTFDGFGVQSLVVAVLGVVVAASPLGLVRVL